MKRTHSLLFIAFVLVSLLVSSVTAYAMHLTEMETIVADSKAAVEQALAQLESANASGDLQAIQLAQDALDMAIANYSVANESLEKARAGESVSDQTMLACGDVASGISNVCSLIAAGSLSDAQAAFNSTSTRFSSLPPAGSGGLPAGLGDIQGDIISALSESSSIMGSGGGGGTGDGLEVSTGTASPI